MEKDLCQGQLPCLPETDLLAHILGMPGLASPFSPLAGPSRERCFVCTWFGPSFLRYMLMPRLSGPCLSHLLSCPICSTPRLFSPSLLHAVNPLGLARALIHLPPKLLSAVSVLSPPSPAVLLVSPITCGVHTSPCSGSPIACLFLPLHPDFSFCPCLALHHSVSVCLSVCAYFLLGPGCTCVLLSS